MDKTSGLGRGLDSLIPGRKNNLTSSGRAGDLSASKDNREEVEQINVDQVSPNPHQPRHSFGADDLQDLMDSIKEHGIIQPVVVTRAGDGWQLIVGERRLRAAKALNMKTIPAIVRTITDQKKMELALIENLQRADLNALEVADAYQKLIDQFNLSQESLAKRVGKARSTVANTLRLLTADEEVKKAVLDKKISEGHARNLASLPQEDQRRLLKQIVANNLSVRQVEQETKRVVVEKHLRKVHFDPELESKKEMMEKALGTKVEIKKSGSGGHILIRFFSDEEFNNIIGRIAN